MTLVPWEPFRNLIALQEKMNRLFDETRQPGPEMQIAHTGTWAPAVDIFENEEEITLTAELPGMELADIDIQVRENALTIKGERKVEKNEKGGSYHRLERSYGAFMRSFTLPSTVDQERISASYTKGMLEIKMPKSARSKPTQIKIDVKD